MSAGTSGHAGRAQHRAPQVSPQDDGGGGKSGRGRRVLWSHHEANTGRPSARQVPIQGSDAKGGVGIPPTRDTGIPQALQVDQDPLVIQLLGATEDPLGPSTEATWVPPAPREVGEASARPKEEVGPKGRPSTLSGRSSGRQKLTVWPEADAIGARGGKCFL